jgi:hypothetical protein
MTVDAGWILMTITTKKRDRAKLGTTSRRMHLLVGLSIFSRRVSCSLHLFFVSGQTPFSHCIFAIGIGGSAVTILCIHNADYDTLTPKCIITISRRDSIRV